MRMHTNRIATLCWMLACGGGPATVTVAPETLPAPPPSASASASPAAKTPADRVQAAVARWLDWLAAGQDEKFLDEAVVPSEWDKILEHKSKTEFVNGFREDKHDGIVKILGKVRGAPPAGVLDAGGYTRVIFDNHETKKIVFQVTADAVHIED